MNKGFKNMRTGMIILLSLLTAIFLFTSCNSVKNISIKISKVSDYCVISRNLNGYLNGKKGLRVINDTPADRIIFSLRIDKSRSENYDISLNDIVERLRDCCTFIKKAETDSAGSISIFTDKWCSLTGNELEEVRKCILRNIDGVPLYVYDIAVIQNRLSIPENIKIKIELRSKNYKKMKKEIHSYVDELTRKYSGGNYIVE